MSKLLNDLISKTISLETCLERLLIISNSSNNKELANWCNNELKGYENVKSLPKYRLGASDNFVYSGFNGTLKVKNCPLNTIYLDNKTFNQIKVIPICSGIKDIEKIALEKNPIYRDWSILIPMVYKNSKKMDPLHIGLQCLEIKQEIPKECYSYAYNSVRARVINLLSSFEQAKIKVDKLDLISKSRLKIISKENNKAYETIVNNGKIYQYNLKSKIFWKIIIPLLTAIIASLITFFITNQFK